MSLSHPTNVVVTTDFSPQALAGVSGAAALARRLGAKLHLLFVVEDQLPPILVGVSTAERREILSGYRKRALELLENYAHEHLEGLDVGLEVRLGVASQEIVEAAEDLDADLLVMSSRGYGPLRQLLMGSTAERVLHHARCPVLLVPVGER